MSSATLKKTTIRQIDIPSRVGHDAILNSTYLSDIPTALQTWGCQRAVLVHSTALDKNTSVISNLKQNLGSTLVASKSGVGAHSPYTDVIAIAKLLLEHDADALISIGSSSYSDAAKIARLFHSTLAPDNLTVDAIESRVDEAKGYGDAFNDPKVKLILVPTSLSASEWNATSSATNPDTHKKQHFLTPRTETREAASAAELILCDPEVAATSPRKLWLSSGMRAVDHCVETIVNPQCTPEAEKLMKEALAILLKGLKEYKDGEGEGDRDELLKGISECQQGSRLAMMGIILHRIPMGASHAIGHQLGSVKGVMHGVTSCVMLASVLRWYAAHNLQTEPQKTVLRVFNETLGWRESSAGDAVEKFVKFLGLPSTLREVDVTKDKDLDIVAEKTLTDIWGGQKAQLDKEEILEILESARG